MISFNENTSFSQGPGLEEILSCEGLLEKSLSNFENRPQQLEMAKAVENAFENSKHLVAEAGTGTGKSFAYLVPAIILASQKRGRVLISTYTINLQSQLINKDIPLLSSILENQFTAVVAKGRGNYLCKRRLAYAMRKTNLFDADKNELMRVNTWAAQTTNGSLSELDFVPSGAVWDAVCSEHGNCRGRKCRHFRDCFYFRARRELESADIIIANHALLFSDLVLRRQEYSLLPDYEYLIIDEAHNIEHVAEDHFGLNITNYTINYLLNGLYNKRTRKGLLANSDHSKAIELVKQARKATDLFFAQVNAWYDNSPDTNGRCHEQFVDDNITPALRDLRIELSDIAKGIEDEDEKFEYMRNCDRCKVIELDIKNFIAHSSPEHVHWVEVSKGRRKRTVLKSAPLNVGNDLRECMFGSFGSIVLTSATLSCSDSKERAGFEFFTSRIGLDEFESIKLGSPFDYSRQAKLYIEADMPEPNDPEFIEKACDTIKKYILKTQGRAFILFTSYFMLNKTAELLSGWLGENDIELLSQGNEYDRATLLEMFKQDNRSVLLGTDSFWQGVDVPGRALSNVIIVRLPFAVPNHPLIQGRIEQVRKKGQNPFYTFQLPTAIIKFKQGFGRLIRHKTDTGIVVVLDNRIVKRSYGRLFIEAIPKVDIEIVTNSEY